MHLCALCGEAFLDLRCFGVRPFGCFTQRYKTSRIIRRDIGQDLAVEFHTGFFVTADELVLADALSARCRADADDPDGPVLALLLLAAGVGKLQPALH